VSNVTVDNATNLGIRVWDDARNCTIQDCHVGNVDTAIQLNQNTGTSENIAFYRNRVFESVSTGLDIRASDINASRAVDNMLSAASTGISGARNLDYDVRNTT
jgi:hypothetical protein